MPNYEAAWTYVNALENHRKRAYANAWLRYVQRSGPFPTKSNAKMLRYDGLEATDMRDVRDRFPSFGLYPPDRNEARGHSEEANVIDQQTYDSIMARERAYEVARERFDPRRYKRGGGYSPTDVDEIERMAGARAPSNEERGAAELYAWVHDPPDKYLAYYNDAMTEIHTWMGDVIGRIVSRGTPTRRMGGTTQSVRVVGTNGVRYHGVCNKTGGTYCRLRRTKG